MIAIAMYLIQNADNHPYHRYVASYAKIDKTTGKSVVIFVNSEE